METMQNAKIYLKPGRAKSSNQIKKSVKLAGAYVILIFAIILSLLPLLWIVTTSIDTTGTLSSTLVGLIPKKITFANYEKLFNSTSNSFLGCLKNSSIVAIATTCISLMLGMTAAYAYSRFRFYGRKSILTMFLLLNAFPSILSIVALFKLLSALNLMNSLLGLILVNCGGQLIFVVWNLKGYFDTLPYEIEEAAFIDGATSLQILTKILFPLSKPAVAVTALFAFMSTWNEYIMAMSFTTDKKLFTLPVFLWSIQNSGDYSMNWPLFCAGSLVVALPIIIVFLILQRSIVSGLHVGGGK
ncbi:MAG: transporter permease subunit [Eubacterium sp.]|jgi:arabinogalactan oligomer/maltooligosaccharide transport system permease protein|nr:transporter permease subunit [Eubacterium sp.]